MAQFTRPEKKPFTKYIMSQKNKGVSTDELRARSAALTAIENLKFLETTFEIDLLALALMMQYGFNSIFDAYYAATALDHVEDHTIISTDSVRLHTGNKKNRPTRNIIPE